jgi:FlaG/FlaF family flagellin (archaellin)
MMDEMKANRKYKENDDAVSAVIGVILMVAITVAIAATVYVYVSGMIGGTQSQTPAVAFVVDAGTDKMTVSSADTGINWDDCQITTDNAAATLSWNGGTPYNVFQTWQNVNNTRFGATGTINAGDYFVVAGVTGSVKVTLRYSPTNGLIGTWTVSV